VNKNEIIKVNLLLIGVLIYLFYNTGFYSDDFIEFITEYNLNIHSLSEFFHIDMKTHHVAIFSVFSSYFHRFWLLLFGDNNFLYFIPKVLISYLAIVLTYKFFRQFLSQHNAMFIAVLFVLFPLHDATNYWYSALKYTMVPAIILYGFYLINQNRFKLGFFTLTFGSFYGFSSPPYIIGLSFYFLLVKEFKKFFVSLIPTLFYILFYFYITLFSDGPQGRIDSGLNILKLIKQYILQIGTFFDTAVGPSMWLKLFYSISNITLTSLSIGVLLIFTFYKYYEVHEEKRNNKLLLTLMLVLALGLGIFSLTSLYPQIAFNLGNRVTIYSSLLLSFIIVFYLLKNKNIATIIFSIFILSVLGISDHWKAWNKTQLVIINNITNNQSLQEFDRTKQLFVSYGQYSKLGSLSHIEFFAQGMTSHIFKLATNKEYKVSTINRRFIKKDDFLVDKKFDIKTKIDDFVYIYDSKENKLITIKKENIQEYINNLPKDNRHWIQLLSKDNFIMKIVLKLMPRLEYAL